MQLSVNRFLLLMTVGSFAFLTACGSSAVKARKEARDKAVQSSKMYCSFVNGEIFPDIDVALNIEMAGKCDSEKAFTIAPYKTPSENVGIIFCCANPGTKAMARAEEPKTEKSKTGEKSTDKKADEPAFGE